MTSTKTTTSGQVIEIKNRNALIDYFLKRGFNVYLPLYDAGIDFIVDHESERSSRKVQLKSRWTIAKKYQNRDIWIAFPDEKGVWFLAPHDKLVEIAEQMGCTSSDSWRVKGLYHRGPLSRELRKVCTEFLLPD